MISAAVSLCASGISQSISSRTSRVQLLICSQPRSAWLQWCCSRPPNLLPSLRMPVWAIASSSVWVN